MRAEGVREGEGMRGEGRGVKKGTKGGVRGLRVVVS